MCRCTRIKDILDVERKVILSHLDKHKWFNHIADPNEAISDFVWKYAWLMREVFCGALCDGKDTCEAALKFQEVFLHDISDGELNVFIRRYHKEEVSRELSWIQLQVVKHHIAVHKWIHSIPNYHDAVSDFLSKFSWVIEEMSRMSSSSSSSLSGA